MTTFKDSTGQMPTPLKRAIEAASSSHVRTGDISVTELIDSPLLFWLKKNKSEELVVEYATRMFALYGTLMAKLLEEYGGDLAEVHSVREHNGVRISGTCDLALDNGRLIDYKFSSVFVASDPKSDIVMKWEQQVNIYRWLMVGSENCNHIVSQIKELGVAIPLRDWGPRHKDKFPAAFSYISVRMWSMEEVEAFITARLNQFASVLSDNIMPNICSDSERWKRDFAVMKQGAKRATKAGFTTRSEAQAYIAQNLDPRIYGVRDAQPKRCIDYCDYAKSGLCPYDGDRA